MSNSKSARIPLVGGFGQIEDFALIKVDHLSWPEAFPHRPEVTARVAHTQDRLLVRFDVRQDAVRAVCVSNNGPVWEDDCVEFFVQTPGSEFYYNFETNCIGVGLAAKRRSREDSTHFTPELMARVVRRSSLPQVPVDMQGECSWSIELELPFSLLDCGDHPTALRANIYKCGNKTLVPHFVSWSPVGTPKPDFHRPEYFGDLELLW